MGGWLWALYRSEEPGHVDHRVFRRGWRVRQQGAGAGGAGEHRRATRPEVEGQGRRLRPDGLEWRQHESVWTGGVERRRLPQKAHRRQRGQIRRDEPSADRLGGSGPLPDRLRRRRDAAWRAAEAGGWYEGRARPQLWRLLARLGVECDEKRAPSERCQGVPEVGP